MWLQGKYVTTRLPSPHAMQKCWISLGLVEMIHGAKKNTNKLETVTQADQ